MYKVEHAIIPEPVTQLFTKQEHSHKTRSVTSGNFCIPHKQLEYGKQCFTYRGSLLWRDIPVTCKFLPSRDAFKKELDKLSCTERAIT